MCLRMACWERLPEDGLGVGSVETHLRPPRAQDPRIPCRFKGLLGQNRRGDGDHTGRQAYSTCSLADP